MTANVVTSYEMLMEALDAGESFDFLFFYGHQQKKPNKIDQSCFSQWFQSGFDVDEVHFKTAEHYMMAQKAKLFEDYDAFQEIINSPDPKTAKQLGRTVQNFDNEIWTAHCFEIVVEGNFQKFSQNPDLLHFILNTDPKMLVEASPHDRIWGIGLGKNDRDALRPERWLGKNLLGFALVEARRRLMFTRQR
jgi:ribA/ribD-fused uncharacterized protein